MADPSELSRLLSQVTYREAGNYFEGLDVFRTLLERDRGGDVRRFLVGEFGKLDGRVRAGIAYALAEHYLRGGDVGALRRLFATDEDAVKEGVLNALWDRPPADDPRVGAALVALALEGARHPAPGVRTEACYVIQNQSGWRVDVSAAVGPLLALLADPSGRVRMQAACAVGNLAKRKYDLAPHAEALRSNLRHADFSARAYSAWALWQLSRSRHDIGRAVADLVGLLASAREEDDDGRKHAAGALLHHAKKSPENRDAVRRVVDAARLDGSRKQVRRFREQLAAVP